LHFGVVHTGINVLLTNLFYDVTPFISLTFQASQLNKDQKLRFSCTF
jgi:hypothetical protein